MSTKALFRTLRSPTIRRRLAALTVVLIAVVGCGGPVTSTSPAGPGRTGSGSISTGAPSTIPGAIPKPGPTDDPDAAALAQRLRPATYSPDATMAAEEALARSGIGTFARPSDTRPVVPLTGPRSPLRLLAFQVHALGVDAWAGHGLSGAQLDTWLPIPDQLQDRTAPTSAFVAGYVAAVRSPGAALARSLMAGQDLTKPQALRVPLLVLMLFTADLSTDGGRHAVSDVGHDPGMIDVIAHPRTGSTQDGIRIQVGVATLCSDAATFIDETIHSLFDALKVAVPDDTVGAIVATIWDWIVDQGEAFVRTLVSAVTDVVLATIRAIAGGIAAVANEVAALVPYVVKVRAEPGDTIALGPGRILGVFIATVTAGDLPDWPDVMKDCASRAQVALPSFRGRNEPVTWGAPVTDAGTLLSPGTFESVTDGNGEARWTFLTKPDPGAAPGQLRNAAIKVDLTVHRAELDDAKQRLADALFSGIPSLLRGFVDEVFGFFIDPLQSAVAALIDTPATGSVTLEYHEAPPPTPSPSASPSAPADIAGTWHGAWASQGYVGLSGGFTLTFIRNGTKLSGDIEISGSRCISTATISGTLNGQKIAFGAVEGGETIGYEGVWNGEAMAGSWTVTRASGGPCTNDGGSWQARR